MKPKSAEERIKDLTEMWQDEDGGLNAGELHELVTLLLDERDKLTRELEVSLAIADKLHAECAQLREALEKYEWQARYSSVAQQRDDLECQVKETK